jgi:tetratricopeptide (TPR) repeat protein
MIDDYEMGLKAYEAQDFERALVYFSNQLKFAPQDFNLWLMMAYCHQGLGQYQEAEKMYKHILQAPMCPPSSVKLAREGLAVVKQASLVNGQGSGDQFNIYCLKHNDRRVALQCQNCKARVCEECTRPFRQFLLCQACGGPCFSLS